MSSISSSSVFLQAVRKGSSLIQPPGNLEGWKRFKTAVSPAIQRSFSSYHVLFLPAVGGQKFVCIFKIGDPVLVEHVIKHLSLDIHEWERDQKNKWGSKKQTNKDQHDRFAIRGCCDFFRIGEICL